MTKVNDYLWEIPHEPLPDDPPEVAVLQRVFNLPLARALVEPLGEIGYTLTSSDVLIPPDSDVTLDRRENYFRANVRFARHPRPDIVLRVHFEHANWSHRLAQASHHTFYINLDRFKLTDVTLRIPEPAWPGRLHTRMSSLPGTGLHYEGDDQEWFFTEEGGMDIQIARFLDKFRRLGDPWLSDERTYGG